jgi:hypothetical protein
MVCVAAYLLANTNAAQAIQLCLPRASKNAEASSTKAVAEGSTKSKTCRHCGKSEAVTPATVETSSNNGEDEPACPCCPHEPGQKNCPCPGECGLCSVAKTPLPAAYDFDVHEALCLGEYLSIDALPYFSAKCGGLDRPPRI